MQLISVQYIWLWTAGLLILLTMLERSRIWLELRAVHDDETAAELVGVNAVAVKVGAFGCGAAVAGISGALFAHHHLYIEPSNFGFFHSIELVLAAILGGSTVAFGGALGAALLVLLPEYLRFLADWRLAAFGALLIFVVVVRRQGILDRSFYRALDRRRAA